MAREKGGLIRDRIGVSQTICRMLILELFSEWGGSNYIGALKKWELSSKETLLGTGSHFTLLIM